MQPTSSPKLDLLNTCLSEDEKLPRWPIVFFNLRTMLLVRVCDPKRTVCQSLTGE